MKHRTDRILTIHVGSLPCRAELWTSWRDANLPDDVIMIPGMITQSNVMVEHPESIAQRLGRWIDAFGVERVIAGTDCGFASFAGNDEIHETIVWAKFDGEGNADRVKGRTSKTSDSLTRSGQTRKNQRGNINQCQLQIPVKTPAS
jgi:5-methyltetrahydropteroyltriglutamate--homocysteine methyltransferase